MNDSRALRRRLLLYAVPVLAFSLLFNLSKFFESRAEEVEAEEEGGGAAATTVRLVR